jgi:hypothetical protein
VTNGDWWQELGEDGSANSQSASGISQESRGAEELLVIFEFCVGDVLAR